MLSCPCTTCSSFVNMFGVIPLFKDWCLHNSSNCEWIFSSVHDSAIASSKFCQNQLPTYLMTSFFRSSMKSIFGFWWTAYKVAWASTDAFSCVVRSSSSLTNILLAWDVPSSMLWVRWELLKRRPNVLISILKTPLFFFFPLDTQRVGTRW